MRLVRIILSSFFITCILSGCAAFRISVNNTDPSNSTPRDAQYNQSDLLSWTDEVSARILSHPFPTPREEKPILIAMGIQNRTKVHLDTKALLDTITTKLLDSGKISLVNASRRDDLLKEQGYQLANCTEATRVKIGKQLGAKYMLTGSLIEISKKSGKQVRVSKKEDVFYQLTIEITNLETGLITLRKQVNRMRTASKPIIGW